MKDGHGNESLKKTDSYTGGFSKPKTWLWNGIDGVNQVYAKHNLFSNWFYGTICGKGELTYSRQVKYGREKVVEKTRFKEIL